MINDVANDKKILLQFAMICSEFSFVSFSETDDTVIYGNVRRSLRIGKSPCGTAA